MIKAANDLTEGDLVVDTLGRFSAFLVTGILRRRDGVFVVFENGSFSKTWALDHQVEVREG